MFLLVHIRKDGTVEWAGTTNPYVPEDMLEEDELGFVLHPTDVKLFEDFHKETDGDV